MRIHSEILIFNFLLVCLLVHLSNPSEKLPQINHKLITKYNIQQYIILFNIIIPNLFYS